MAVTTASFSSASSECLSNRLFKIAIAFWYSIDSPAQTSGLHYTMALVASQQETHVPGPKLTQKGTKTTIGEDNTSESGLEFHGLVSDLGLIYCIISSVLEWL